MNAKRIRSSIERPLGLAILVFLVLGRAEAKALRFVVITDSHIGAGAAAEDLAAVVASINARRDVAFVVHTGDITEKGRDTEFAEARRLLSRLAVPWYVVPGNHDAHWIGRGLAGYRAAFDAERFFFERDGRAAIGLSTGEFGHLSPEDLAFLKMSLAKVPTASPVLLFIHFPPGSVDNWDLAHNLLRERNATVFCGHGHATRLLGPAGVPAVMARASVSGKPPGVWGYALVTDAAEASMVEEVAGTSAPRAVGRIEASGRTALPAMEAVEAENSGAFVLWRTDLRATLSCAPIVAADRVLLQTLSGRLVALDMSGREKWTYETGSPLVGRPAVREEALFAASADGRVMKLDLASGRLLVSARIGERVTSDLAILDRGRAGFGLLLGTVSGRLLCLDGERLVPRWESRSAADAVQSRPLAVGTAVVFGAWDARLHAVSASDGRELWTWTENDNFYYSPAGCAPATDGTWVFVCCPDGFVSAVDITTGRTVWRTQCASWESLALTPDTRSVLVKSRIDEFRVLDAATGGTVRTVSPAHGTGDLIPCEPLFWEGAIVYGGQNGNVYRIPPSGAVEIILRLGPAAIFPVPSPRDGVFVAADADGRVAAFRLEPAGLER